MAGALSPGFRIRKLILCFLCLKAYSGLQIAARCFHMCDLFRDTASYCFVRI